MKTKEIKLILQDVLNELNKDKKWKEWSDKTGSVTPTEIQDWLKKNRVDLVKKLQTLKAQDAHRSGFIGMMIAFGGLMK